MLRQLGLSILALIGFVTIAAAQRAHGAIGTWKAQALLGPKDSVVVAYALTVAEDGKSATIEFPNRDPIPGRVVVLAGDSIVIEAGPYASSLKAGLTVTSFRTVAHVKGDTMTGTFVADYSNGEVHKGKIKAARAK
jgi:hypothetical protein